MHSQWFAGANTPEGFISHYSCLVSAPQIQNALVLKGGPGCGKSTFMKKIRQTAMELGAETESYLCSGDPDSLDGLYIPALGLTIVDGTAPHVVEPEFCGCNGQYLNLGAYYRPGLSRFRDTLQDLQTKSGNHYRRAYALLRRNAKTPAVLSKPLFRMLYAMLPHQDNGTGSVTYRFLRAFTHKGLMDSGASTILYNRSICLLDPGRQCGGTIKKLGEALVREGQRVVFLCDPWVPSMPEGLLLPHSGTLLLAKESPDPAFQITVNPEAFLPSAPKPSLHYEAAIAELKKAKQLHDEIEEIYKPYVSFAGINLLTEEYQKQIKEGILQVT